MARPPPSHRRPGNAPLNTPAAAQSSFAGVAPAAPGNQQMLRALGIRPALAIRASSDPEEHEADLAADAFVARAPLPVGFSARGVMTGIRRQAAPDTAANAAAPPVPKPPSDIDLGFNALDASHRLIESIDQSQIKLEDDPYDNGRFFKRKRFVRHIDFPLVLAVLSNLTAGQVKEVEAEYLAYEKRPLQRDLFGWGQSGFGSDLTVDQTYRLKALLAGTKASSEEDAEAAAKHQREGDVAELHALLYGSLGAGEIERVMTLLRRPADEATAILNEYDLNHDLRSDLFRMGIANAIRAMMLLSGSSIAADAYAIGMARSRIIAIDEALKALQPTELTVTTALITVGQALSPTAAWEHRRQIEALTAERKALVQSLEERVQVAAGEAKMEAEREGKDVLDTDTAIRTRVSWVLGPEGATEAVFGGASAKLIGAVAANDPSEQVAAQLRKLEEAGKLTTGAMADAFRGLRMQAAEEAQRRYPDATADELKEEERKLSDRWFIHLRSTWDAAVVGEGRTFSQILDRGDQTEVDLKRRLYMASGRLEPADELVLALAGDRKDMETVKRVLSDKNAAQIADLKLQYRRKTIQLPYWPMGRSLDFDLFGTAPTKAGEKQEIDFSTGKPKGPQGKASGTDRLVLEDYLQRPSHEGDMEEVDYIAGRAEREYQYTIDNRGATGWWRDHWGNEARSLLDATINEVRLLRIVYMTVTWNGTDKEAVKSAGAHRIIRRMHLARATIRGDRAGYEKATAELRATFQAVASFVLQAVLTAVLTPFATALFAARLAQLGAMASRLAQATARFAAWTKTTVVGMASTIAANKTVYGSDYDKDMLFRDLRGGLGPAIGATGVGRLLGPVSQRLTDRLGKTVAGELIAGAKTAGGMEVTAALEGEPANLFENFLENHFLGKVGDVITHGTRKVIGRDPTAGKRAAAAEEPHARGSGAGAEHEVGPARPADAGAADIDIPDELAIRTPMKLEEIRTPMALEPRPAKPALPAAEPAAVAKPPVSEPAAMAASEPAPIPAAASGETTHPVPGGEPQPPVPHGEPTPGGPGGPGQAGEPPGPRLPHDFAAPDDFTFTTEGPRVATPVSPSGAPAHVLEIGAGPTDTNLGLAVEPGQGDQAMHDASLVNVTRTDVQARPGAGELNAQQPIPPEFWGQDVVIINNPRGYRIDIANVGQAVRPGGRIVIQGRAEVVRGMRGINPDMNPILQQALAGDLPPGYRVVSVEMLPEVRGGDPTAVPKPPQIIGGPFQRTTGGPVGWPNTQIVIERIVPVNEPVAKPVSAPDSPPNAPIEEGTGGRRQTPEAAAGAPAPSGPARLRAGESPSERVVLYRGTVYRWLYGRSGETHDLGPGLYMTSDRDLAVKYAQERRVAEQAVGEGTPGIVMRVEADLREFGRVLDVYHDPARRAEWESFLRTQPNGDSVLAGQVGAEIYNAYFENWLYSRGARLDQFDTIIAPEYIRGGPQVCIRDESIQARLFAKWEEWARAHEPLAPAWPDVKGR
jgi:hypothetical protein